MTTLLFTAQDMNMTNGDYAFFTFGLLPYQSSLALWNKRNMTANERAYRMNAFYVFKQVFTLYHEYCTTVINSVPQILCCMKGKTKLSCRFRRRSCEIALQPWIILWFPIEF
jgi:hypothetical protein